MNLLYLYMESFSPFIDRIEGFHFPANYGERSFPVTVVRTKKDWPRISDADRTLFLHRDQEVCLDSQNAC